MLIVEANKVIPKLNWIVLKGENNIQKRLELVKYLVGKSCIVYTGYQGYLMYSRYLGEGVFKIIGIPKLSTINWRVENIDAVALDPVDILNNMPC